MRMFVTLSTATLAAGLLVSAAAPPAVAEDQRHCVSKVELHSLYVVKDTIRDKVEERLEVLGRGRPIRFYDGETYVLRYPACGYSIKEAWVLIQYRWRDDMIVAAERHVKPGATLHGRP